MRSQTFNADVCRNDGPNVRIIAKHISHGIGRCTEIERQGELPKHSRQPVHQIARCAFEQKCYGAERAGTAPRYELEGDFTLHGTTRKIKVLADATSASGYLRLRG